MSFNESLQEVYPQKIYLTYLNGTGYIFNVDDFMTIRTKHRIVGNLVGTCSIKGWNPNNNGLPAELTKFETQLLVEKGLAILVKKSLSFKANPPKETIQEYKELIEKRFSELSEIYKVEKLRESQKFMDKIIAGRKKKLLRSGVEEKDINLTEEDMLKEIEESFVFDKNNALLDIPCEHPFEHDAQIVALPVDNSLKYRVFKNLWEKEKYVTSGEAFGADFITYPGDPLIFHASHIVIILEDPNVMPLDLIAKCRLSVIVNKICMFAYLDDNGDIAYQSVQWEGCKDNVKKNELCADESVKRKLEKEEP